MTWASSTQIRLVSGLSSTATISAADVTSFITEADRETAKQVLEYHYNESVLEGAIDGSNKSYRLRYKPVGDKDQSGTVDSDDITVYTITTNATTGFDESASVSVTSVNARDGIFVLTSAAASTVNDIKVDYATINSNIVLADVKLAASYLAAVMIMIDIENAKFATSPYSYTAGKFRIDKNQHTKEESKMSKLYWHFKRLINVVIAPADMQKVRPSTSELDKSSFRGRGTTGGAKVSRNIVFED